MSKAAKHRFCPATQRDISSAECGENRGSRYACPSDCLHSPHASANYDLLLKVEDQVDAKTRERFQAEERKSPELNKESMLVSNSPSGHARHAFVERVLFFQRDAGGLTLAERWRREGLSGMRNDERVLFGAKMRTRIALLEIHRIIDDQQIEAVDLLEADPRPMILRDRSLASMASRFATALAWVYPLPHYWRLSGTAIILSDMAQFEPAEIIREIAQHLGAPLEEKELRIWLAENFVRVDESLQATWRMRRLQMFSEIDADYGKAVYELRAPFGACRDALDEVAEVEPESLSPAERDEGFAEARVWLTEQDPARMGGAKAVLGRVLLGQSHCRLEGMGRQRFARLRKQLEKTLGERVRFTNERFEDLTAKLAQKEPPPNLAIIPPRLLEQPEKIVIGSSRIERPAGASLEDLEARQSILQDRDFLENPVPALDGSTPRQAAKNPVLRPKLIRLLKERVRQHDERNLRTGRNDDINWLLRELDVPEITFDPPPLRAKLPEYDEPAGHDPADFIDDSDFPWPNLPPEPLSPGELDSRLDDVLRKFTTAEEALDYLEACDSLFLDDAASLCEAQIKPEEFIAFLPWLAQARFALVPIGFREPELNYDRLCNAIHESLDRLDRQSEKSGPKVIQGWVENSRQPVLSEMLACNLTASFLEFPKDLRPSPPSQLFMILALSHMIDELDRSIRG